MKGATDRNGSTHIQKRVLGGKDIAEVYLTARATTDVHFEYQARHLYAAIRDELTAVGARILSERMFATAECFPAIDAIRRSIYDELDDGVPPTRVIVAPNPTGSAVSAQVHAVCSRNPPRVLCCWDLVGGTAARLFEHKGVRWFFVNGMNVPGDEAEAVRRTFSCAGCLLKQVGGSMKSVVRTWLWLKDVCGWYDDLDAARTSFFQRAGLIGSKSHATRLPASTGVGLHTPEGASCALDFVAIPGSEDQIQFVDGGGDQHPPLDYGWAVSRAATAPMPGGQTVFISGTAAIDAEGHTQHLGGIDAQIDATVAHTRALLSELGCRDENVLTALVYCKTASVERAFHIKRSHLPWPCLCVIGDVCRPDLLFEIEVTASREL